MICELLQKKKEKGERSYFDLHWLTLTTDGKNLFSVVPDTRTESFYIKCNNFIYLVHYERVKNIL